jgi:hypothetical protein
MKDLELDANVQRGSCTFRYLVPILRVGIGTFGKKVLRSRHNLNDGVAPRRIDRERERARCFVRKKFTKRWRPAGVVGAGCCDGELMRILARAIVKYHSLVLDASCLTSLVIQANFEVWKVHRQWISGGQNNFIVVVFWVQLTLDHPQVLMVGNISRTKSIRILVESTIAEQFVGQGME